MYPPRPSQWQIVKTTHMYSFLFCRVALFALYIGKRKSFGNLKLHLQGFDTKGLTRPSEVRWRGYARGKRGKKHCFIGRTLLLKYQNSKITHFLLSILYALMTDLDSLYLHCRLQIKTKLFLLPCARDNSNLKMPYGQGMKRKLGESNMKLSLLGDEEGRGLWSYTESYVLKRYPLSLMQRKTNFIPLHGSALVSLSHYLLLLCHFRVNEFF